MPSRLNSTNSTVPAPTDYGTSVPRGSSVADRIKQWSIRDTQAQVEIVQEQLSRSRSMTSRFERPPPTTPSFPVTRTSTSTVRFTELARNNTSIPVLPPKKQVSGDWPWEDGYIPRITNTLPSYKQPQGTTQSSRVTEPSVRNQFTTPVRSSSAVRATPALESAEQPECQHRETLRFAAPAGPRTEYAYEHHGKTKQQQDRGSSEYKPSVPKHLISHMPPSTPRSAQSETAIRMPSPVRGRPSSARGMHQIDPTSANAAWAKLRNSDHSDAPSRMTPESIRSSSAPDIHESRDLDANDAWVKFKDQGFGGSNGVLANPPSLMRPFTPPTIRLSSACIAPLSQRSANSSPQRQSRATSENIDNPMLTISAKGTALNNDATMEVISSVPLLKNATPQATLTFSVSHLPMAYVQIQSQKNNCEVQTIVVPGEEPLETTTTATYPYVPEVRKSPAVVDVNSKAQPRPSLQATRAASTLNVPSIFSKEVSGTSKSPSARAAAVNVTSIPQPEPLPAAPTTREILDTIVLEHRAALTSITRKLTIELGRLEADYDSVMIPTPVDIEPTTGAALSEPPPSPFSSSFPEPHRVIVEDVIPVLSRQSRRMQELIDEVVRHARETWCVDLLSCSAAWFCRRVDDGDVHVCGWNAKIEQIRREQMSRADRVQVWAGFNAIEEPRPLLCARIGGGAQRSVHGEGNVDVELGVDAKADAWRSWDLEEYAGDGEEEKKDSATHHTFLVLPDSQVSEMDSGILHKTTQEGQTWIELKSRNPECFGFPAPSANCPPLSSPSPSCTSQLCHRIPTKSSPDPALFCPLGFSHPASAFDIELECGCCNHVIGCGCRCVNENRRGSESERGKGDAYNTSTTEDPTWRCWDDEGLVSEYASLER